MCARILNGERCNDLNCSFAHDASEYRRAPTPQVENVENGVGGAHNLKEKRRAPSSLASQGPGPRSGPEATRSIFGGNLPPWMQNTEDLQTAIERVQSQAGGAAEAVPFTQARRRSSEPAVPLLDVWPDPDADWHPGSVSLFHTDPSNAEFGQSIAKANSKPVGQNMIGSELARHSPLLENQVWTQEPAFIDIAESMASKDAESGPAWTPGSLLRHYSQSEPMPVLL